MNILLSSKCNRKCPYCFAAERISFSAGRKGRHRKVPEFISVKNFDTCIRFAKKSRQRAIGLLGGEPSLHPKFIALLQRAWNAGLQTRIFTNGMWPEEHLEAFLNIDQGLERKVHIVVNTNHPDMTPQKQREAQDRFLSALGHHCALSFNIHDAKFDPTFLLDVIKRYRTKKDIRLGLAEPLAELDNRHLDVADYPKMTPALMRLADACDRDNILMTFDCGFTLCMFTPDEFGRILLAGARFKASCAPVIDVGTDLSVWACFPLSTLSQGVYLPDFDNINALARHFFERFGRLYGTGVLTECVDCRFRKRKQCAGGCGAHVYRSFNP